ncbi:F-box/kelch-repeat protein At3g23880-like [Papaver somniferum]|uniref:F-box/kelch-repeat protein At3g23880-like n=1 Tax=Papaver somniferum TaxID=3469 RepID=UPI000E6FAC3F|nr:F-box/kelch-repeat protein At3g23880-like [Papaver somniferum]
MDNLPVEITLNIFYRFSAETVLECQRVCKTWQNLLSLDKTNFADVHLRHQLLQANHQEQQGANNFACASVGLIFLIKSHNKETSRQLYYGEFDENRDYHEQCICNTLRRICRKFVMIDNPSVNQLTSGGMYYKDLLVGSINGLVCFAEPKPNDRNDIIRDPIHIFNPITKEHLHLQGFNEKHAVRRIYSGFGYNHQTNEYKVVRILSSDDSKNGDIEVHTLGRSNRWRNIGVINNCFSSAYGVFANGALLWLDIKEEEIMAFNLSDEKFHAIQLGELSYRAYCGRISILRTFGEWLFVSSHERYKPKCLDIWALKKTLPSERSTGTNAPTTSNDQNESLSWCKEFSITPENSSSP